MHKRDTKDMGSGMKMSVMRNRSISEKHQMVTAGICLGILTLFFLIPYLQNGLVYGDDYLYHLARIETIADNIRTGDFPVKIHNAMNLGYGYGTGFFYPDFFLYIPALLMLMGVSLWNAYKCFAGLMAFGCVVSVYLCAKYMCRHTGASLFASAAYLFSQPLLMDLYERFAIGECLAFIFVPVIFCGAYNLFTEQFSRPWILGLGFTGVALSHPVTLCGALIGMALACLCNIRIFIRKPQILGRLIMTALSVMALSASYWIPMLEQLLSGQFHFMEPWTRVWENTSAFVELWQGQHGIGAAMKLMIAANICGILGTMWVKLAKGKHGKSDNEGIWLRQWKTVILWTFCALALILITAFKPFWELTEPVLNFLQFPWRIYIYALSFLTFAFAFVVKEIAETGAAWNNTEKQSLPKANKRRITLTAWIQVMVVTVSVIIIVGSGISYVWPRMNMLAGPELLDVCAYTTSNGGGEEWQPVGFSSNDLDPDMNSSVVYMTTVWETVKNGSEISFAAFAPSVQESVSGQEDAGAAASTYYLLPYVYYKGYFAVYVDNRGETQRLTVERDLATNLAKIKSVQNETPEGEYTVCYRGTLLQYVSYGITVLSWAFLFVFVFKAMSGRNEISSQ